MSTYATFRDAVENTKEQRRDFFRLIFGDPANTKNTGYVCLAFKKHLEQKMDEEFFYWPTQEEELLDAIDNRSQNLVHVYFCPQLLADKNYRTEDGHGPRVKENVKDCTVLWADLDTCNPQYMQVDPSIVMQTSVGRYQALWRLDQPINAFEAAIISQRIAYFHAEQGCDKSGWILTKLLRVPYTPNYKYGDMITAPLVVVLKTGKSLYRREDFECYPAYEALKPITSKMSTIPDLPPELPLDILQRYRPRLNPLAFGLFNDPPESRGESDEGWSGKLWRLEKYCIEAGMKIEEVFVICRDAACNKYKRDGRPPEHLWGEVSKNYLEYIQDHNLVPTPTSTIPEFLTEEEVHKVQARETFVERYIKWASLLTDAAVQYHQAGAFILLSSMMSGNAVLPTSFGNVYPNIWFMILADTTLTRKSTAMDIAWDMLKEVYPDAIIATDGSPEGILTALKDRAKKPSIYFRDEFTGMLEVMSHKEYMAGMAETFTKLYDGRDMKRLLRREEIIVKDPRFMMFVGGIKSKTQMLLTDEHVNSGFIPRFVFITAEPDPSSIRPVGPPKPIDTEARESIKNELWDMYNHYNQDRMVIIGETTQAAAIKPHFTVELTHEAWLKYNRFENMMTQAALATELWHLTPVYDRLAKSMLKAAILIAGSSQRTENIVVTEDDINHAIYYCQTWRVYANEIVNGIGKSQEERLIDQIMKLISHSQGNGVPRSEIMNLFKMSSKQAEVIFSTMIQRRLIVQFPVNGQPRYLEVS